MTRFLFTTVSAHASLGLLILAGIGLAAVQGQQVPRVRTPDERFAALPGYAFTPHYLDLDGLRVHYLDEGSGRAGTMLLLHGEPTWSYLYRNLIPVFTAAGYRIIAPDMIGFGRSDKVTDPAWYTLDRHVATLRRVIEQLDLRGIILVCQDWGGPVGLVNATEMPGRFSRLVILNTWLHHEGFEYTGALRNWHRVTQEPGFDFQRPMKSMAAYSPDSYESLRRAYGAPFDRPESLTGAIRWPWMLPFMNPAEGGAARQAKAYEALKSTTLPAHVIFGDPDAVFTTAWGREFAAHIPGATFDVVPNSGHFVQEVGRPLAELILNRLGGR